MQAGEVANIWVRAAVDKETDDSDLFDCTALLILSLEHQNAGWETSMAKLSATPDSIVKRHRDYQTRLEMIQIFIRVGAGWLALTTFPIIMRLVGFNHISYYYAVGWL